MEPWVKILLSTRKNRKMKIIKALPEGDAICCMWYELIQLAAEVADEGWIYITKGQPYSNEELAVELDRTVFVVDLALKTYHHYKMITLADEGILLNSFAEIQNIDALQSIRESNRNRQARFREKKREKMLLIEGNKLIDNKDNNVSVTLRNAIDEDEDEEYIRENILNYISNNINKNYFESFFKNMKVMGKNETEIILGFSSEYIARQVEENCMETICRALQTINCQLKPCLVLYE